ncbi:transcriptional activator HlyU [Agrobacterium pusense]|uniref:HlyU family transcriptional regulator n=2 Tax=Agrobacterium TaxID=357 RepID=UPI000DDD135C|nr:HlyU family transcriptional regulator [Agrobacterium pusense]MBW9077634.1 transcriptional activator HlyU [Agrobacterium pusense]MDH0113346.1 HlyU family transcriptional regulator [Agrobacterium pusense]QCL83961.1 transcriptional activator HlyU [Agrobacterium pusense]
MASFFSKILSAFGSGQPSSDAPQKTAQAEPHAHGDYVIYATPIKEGGQFRLAGRIEKKAGDEVLVHEFVRADVFTSLDDAVEFTIRKAKLIIDQNGSSLFPGK